MPGGDGEPGTASGVAGAELSPDQVTGLLERLAAKEREKREVREQQRRAAQVGVERDW